MGLDKVLIQEQQTKWETYQIYTTKMFQAILSLSQWSSLKVE